MIQKYEIWILCIMYYTVFLSYFKNTCILYFRTLLAAMLRDRSVIIFQMTFSLLLSKLT